MNKTKHWFSIEEAAAELDLTVPEIEAAIDRWSRREAPALWSVKRSGQRMLHQASLNVYRAQLKLHALTPEQREARIVATRSSRAASTSAQQPTTEAPSR